MNDDFFKQLDGKIAGAKSTQAADIELKDSNRLFASTALAELQPIAEEYARRLGERKITAKVRNNGVALSFELHWSNGDDHGLSIESESGTNRLKIVRYSTDHTTRKRFHSTSGNTYDASSWKTSHFEDALQSVINEYVTLADKHSGLS